MRILAAILAVWAGSALAENHEADYEAGRALYRDYCATCHGMEGRGDGPMGMILNIVPSDLTMLYANNDDGFPRMRTIMRIDGRDPIIGHTGAMPIFGPVMEGKSAVLDAEDGTPILTTQRMADLIAWLEQIQR